jgi:hypothetical protein
LSFLHFLRKGHGIGDTLLFLLFLDALDLFDSCGFLLSAKLGSGCLSFDSLDFSCSLGISQLGSFNFAAVLVTRSSALRLSNCSSHQFFLVNVFLLFLTVTNLSDCL